MSLPKCVKIRQTCAGTYEICHQETSIHCNHEPSGEMNWLDGGNSRKPCNRILGEGKTRKEARELAKEFFDV